MIKPRNSLVVLRLIEKAEYKVGKITVPSNSECYCEAEVVAVGPGCVSAEGGRSETFDLKPGQRVWVKHKTKFHQGQMTRLEDAGLPYRDGEVTYHGFEQTSIIGILAEPDERPLVDLSRDTLAKLAIDTVEVGKIILN
jgi:co-chaperonin GroES (HSP10)